MKISSFNVNKFCGPYSNKGYYYNPRNIDFKTPIKNIVCQQLITEYDIFFMQEVCDNEYIAFNELFPTEKYKIIKNVDNKKSNVVAIVLKDSNWDREEPNGEHLLNKYLKVNHKKKCLDIACFHNTDLDAMIEEMFVNNKKDIILGDFNDKELVKSIKDNHSEIYRDIVTDDMITYKPAQSTIDHVFLKKNKTYDEKVLFNGIVETYLSDHNLITFHLNV